MWYKHVACLPLSFIHGYIFSFISFATIDSGWILLSILASSEYNCFIIIVFPNFCLLLTPRKIPFINSVINSTISVMALYKPTRGLVYLLPLFEDGQRHGHSTNWWSLIAVKWPLCDDIKTFLLYLTLVATQDVRHHIVIRFWKTWCVTVVYSIYMYMSNKSQCAIWGKAIFMAFQKFFQSFFWTYFFTSHALSNAFTTKNSET